MSLLDNPYLFNQIGLDSGALTQLGAVVHQFSAAGAYSGTIFRQEDIVATFTLRVDEACPATQVNIDLAATGSGSSCCGQSDSPAYSVRPGGYALFFVGSGAGGLSVTVAPPGQAPLFDSRSLQPGDHFSATILRPGAYVARSNGAADCRIVSAYPSGRREVAYQPPAPARVAIADGRFATEVIELKAAQSVVFEVKQQARVVISLVTPDDGPPKTKQRRPLVTPGGTNFRRKQ